MRFYDGHQTGKDFGDGRMKEIEALVLGELQNIHGRLAGEIPRAKAELAKHCMEITLTPEGNRYKLSGEWDLLGEVRSDVVQQS